jgi:hypothetical protein
MWAQLAEAKWRRDLSEQCDDIQMFDATFSVGIVLGPETYELLQMMRTEDTPVSRQVIEVVHDDGDEQVDDEKRAEHEERDEIRIGEVDAANVSRTVVLVVVGLRIALDLFAIRAGQHDLLPCFARRCAITKKPLVRDKSFNRCNGSVSEVRARL